MKKQILLYAVAILTLFCTIGCTFNDNEDEQQGTSKTIAGTVQKGPFVTGTPIKVQMLDNGLNPNGSSMETQITDDFGHFTVTGKVDGEYAEIIGTGYYFNEVANHLSSSTLVLRGLTKIESAGTANLNILTTLQAPRVKKLVGEGKSFAAAGAQSQAEILNAFGIELNNCPSFDKLNIAESGDANAVLLAISAIMQVDRNEAELSEFIAKVANDIADNGKLDNGELAETIRQGHMSVDPDKVRENLIARYAALGQSNVSIPDITDYLDSDGNGTLNEDETMMNFKLSLEYYQENTSKAALNNTYDLAGKPYDNLTDITVLAFDKSGNNIFVQRDVFPLIEDDSYSFAFTPQNGQRVFDNSTVYVLLNCPKDYSKFAKTENEFIAEDLMVDLESANEAGLKIGKESAYLTTAKENAFKVPVQLPYAKVKVEIDFADDVPADKRTISLVSLNDALMQSFVFGAGKDGLPTTNIRLIKDNDTYWCWVLKNSPMNISIETTGGTYNLTVGSIAELPMDGAKQHTAYECKATITSSGQPLSRVYMRLLTAQQDKVFE